MRGVRGVKIMCIKTFACFYHAFSCIILQSMLTLIHFSSAFHATQIMNRLQKVFIIHSQLRIWIIQIRAPRMFYLNVLGVELYIESVSSIGD